MNLIDLQKWFRIRGDDTLRIDYPLNENSIVFDLGGYHGKWAEKIYEKYQCQIYIFEPIPKLCYDLIKKFQGEKKIKIFNFGVSDSDKFIEIALLNDGSSFYVESQNKISVQVVSLIRFLDENKIDNVDLIKINIEGDEFPVLKSLLDNARINIFNNIQVQFHQFIPNSVNLRNLIRDRLISTHKLTYDYEFVWENWEKIKF
jgi:FkbM family methyltransferase